MKKKYLLITIFVVIGLVTTNTVVSKIKLKSVLENGSVEEKVDYLVKHMSLNEKVGQMVQAERNFITPKEVKTYHIGSIFSGGGSTPGNNTVDDWRFMIEEYQEAALSSGAKIPLIYGLDAVHGNSHLSEATIFPHNIGIGATNDAELTKKIGEITAKEMLTTGVPWAFAPCVPVAKDPRWGRFYESYSDNVELTTKLSSALTKGLQENGVAATAKHYIGDGGTSWGTGSYGYKIDRGVVEYSEEIIRKEFLPPYIEAVNNNISSVMASFSSIGNTKMHENKYWLTDVLKGELKFKGFVVSDWEGIHEIGNVPLDQQIVIAVNSGIDMLMEPDDWKVALKDLKKAVKDEKISEERIDDAVSRILRAKFEVGLFENSKLVDKNLYPLGNESHREVAKEVVKKSMVLLKNENNVLPLKEGSKIFVTGPAADNISVQCGGWTIDWQGGDRVPKGTSILEGFKKVSEKTKSTIITDINQAKDADVTVVVIGEKTYAEGKGDDETLGIADGMALEANAKAIEDAKALGKPVVVILVSGRPRIVTEEVKNWDGFVCAWLPGTEGDGVAEVLYGLTNFTGKLPVNWPKSVDDLPIKNSNDALYPFGYGLQY